MTEGVPVVAAMIGGDELGRRGVVDGRGMLDPAVNVPGDMDRGFVIVEREIDPNPVSSPREREDAPLWICVPAGNPYTLWILRMSEAIDSEAARAPASKWDCIAGCVLRYSPLLVSLSAFLVSRIA